MADIRNGIIAYCHSREKDFVIPEKDVVIPEKDFVIPEKDVVIPEKSGI